MAIGLPLDRYDGRIIPSSSGAFPSDASIGDKERKIIKKILEGKGQRKDVTFSPLIDLDTTVVSLLKSNFNLTNNNQLLTSFEVTEVIKATTKYVYKLMMEKQQGKEKRLNQDNERTLNKFNYSLYIYWITRVLKSNNNLNIDESTFTRLSSIGENHTGEMHNIFQNKSLTTLFYTLEVLGIINFSDNTNGDFPMEVEKKVLDINPDEIEEKLEKIKKDNDIVSITKLYNGQKIKIEDNSYDSPWLMLGNSGKTLRTRSIISSGTRKEKYTIKRRKDVEVKKENEVNDDPKECFELEEGVIKAGDFEKIISTFGLVQTKEKKKDRQSYCINLKVGKEVKIDIEFIHKIPVYLEIEGTSGEIDDVGSIKHWIKRLGLENHTVLSTGTTGLFDYYGKRDEYIKDYSVTKYEDGYRVINWMNSGLTYFVNEKGICEKVRKIKEKKKN